VDYALLVERLSAMFGFRAVPRELARAASLAPAPPAPPQPAPPAPERRPPSATNGLFSGPPACPNCGQPLQHATLAGYRVAYCDNCKYKSQTLAQGPRR
jgi:chromosome partitioning protein